MGVPGVDGMTVEEALPWLKEHKVKNRDINLCLDIRVDLPVVVVVSREICGLFVICRLDGLLQSARDRAAFFDRIGGNGYADARSERDREYIERLQCFTDLFRIFAWNGDEKAGIIWAAFEPDFVRFFHEGTSAFLQDLHVMVALIRDLG